MQEIWKDITEYEGSYQVSNFGNVRRLDRQVGSEPRVRVIKGKILKKKINKGGYHCVHLRDGKIESHPSVHRLVAEHFIENKDSKPTVNHIDGNKLNNHFNNLEWATHEEQSSHAISSGLRIIRGKPKFSKSFKKEILDYYLINGCSIVQLAKHFEVSERTAGRIVNNGVHARTTTKVKEDGSLEVREILTKGEVSEIKKLRSEGLTLLEISKMFNRGTSQIWRVCKDLSRTTNIE